MKNLIDALLCVGSIWLAIDVSNRIGRQNAYRSLCDMSEEDAKELYERMKLKNQINREIKNLIK